LQFAGIDSISEAEGVVGLDVIVPIEERQLLDEESAYISDLIGCTLYDGTASVGVIEDVQFPSTPDGSRKLEDAAPLLEVRSNDGDEILVPFAKAFLVGVDTGAKRVDMVLPIGLVDVNRTANTDADQKR
jgi:16S rRNA processing protein RimM